MAHIAIMLSAACMTPACSQLHVTIRHHSPCVSDKGVARQPREKEKKQGGGGVTRTRS